MSFYGNFESAKRTYFSVKSVIQNGKDAAKFVSKVINLDTGEKEEVFTDYVQGPVLDIIIKDEEYEGNPSPKLEITIGNATEKVIIKVGAFSTVARDVMLKLPSVSDFTRTEVRLTPYLSEDTKSDKKYVHMSLKVNGEKLPYAYAREEVPQVVMQQVPVGKKMTTVTDSTDRDEFFRNVVKLLRQRIQVERSAQTVSRFQAVEDVDTYAGDDEADAADRLINKGAYTKDGVPF